MKRSGFKYIILSLLTVVLLMVTGCSSSHEDSPELMTQDPMVVMTVRSLTQNTQGTSSSTLPEKIRSLRVVMLNNGKVELNEYVDFTSGSYSGSGSPSAGFSYNLMKKTVAGEKQFFLIANEETVKEVKFISGTVLPQGIENGISLSGVLEHYTGDGKDSQNEFSTVMNALYFDNPDPVSSDAVYLPYSAYYDGFSITEGTNDTPVYTKEMYLVPVATKFTFNFTNRRRDAVEILALDIENLNNSNYLLPKIDESEKEKTYNGETVSWIEWLKYISEESWNHLEESENTAFNQNYGWIMEYSIPREDAAISSFKKDNGWILEKPINKDTPSKKTFGPFYRAETKHLINQNQSYRLNLDLKDLNDTEVFNGRGEIDNLFSLFRSTHVIINVDLYLAEMDIYAEIKPWNIEEFIGYLQEAEEDD